MCAAERNSEADGTSRTAGFKVTNLNLWMMVKVTDFTKV
jgi:hypothetical protein